MISLLPVSNAVVQHLLRLSAPDRRLRFGERVKDAYIEDYCSRVNWLTDTLYGAFADGELRAVAIMSVIEWQLPISAAAAVSVEGGYQNSGVGTRLVERLLTAAQNRLIHRLFMLCLTENDRMNHVAEKLGGRIDFFRGTSEAKFRPGPPTPLSITREIAWEGNALAQTAVSQVTGMVPFLASKTA